MFKSDDTKRQEAAQQAGNACKACSGTGTYGIGGRGAMTSNSCSNCGGTGQKT